MSTENSSKEFDDKFDNVIQLMWSSGPNSSHKMFALLDKLTREKYGHAKGLHKLKEKPEPTQDNEPTSSADTITADLMDLFEEDLKCVICSNITVSYRNQLMECNKCHLIYHQNCHSPPIDQIDTNIKWTCHKCLNPETSDTALIGEKSSGDSGNDEISNITKFLELVKSGSSANNIGKSKAKRMVKKVSKNANELNNVQPLKPESSAEYRKKLVSLKAKESRSEQNIVKPSTSKNEIQSKNEPVNQVSAKIPFRNAGPTMNLVNAEKRLYYMKKRAAENSRLRR